MRARSRNTRNNMIPDTNQHQTGSDCPTPTCALSIYEMARRGMKLPKGTRIRTTRGGVKTRATHQISESLLAKANSISDLFADERPFWCYGWRDLHGDLFLPAND